ncbi:hypothetical protein BVRB_9g218250 [Beta vulgaris subsp. vulgaris]|nr:hypothetical protein BVRB_9g218250 [Beta vulgaris subsp. vulgaris]
MAGEILGAWVDELNKLREKARAKNAAFAKASNDPKKETLHLVGKSTRKDEKELLLSKKTEESSTSCSFQETSTLSESTMCLLLDRFVPC